MAALPRQLHVFSTKNPSSSSPSSSSTLNSTKIKTLIQTAVFSHLCRAVGALARAKSILLHVLKHLHVIHLHFIIKKNAKNHNNNNKKKLFLGSFRLHYNWCSSHVAVSPPPAVPPTATVNYHVVTKCLNSCNNEPGLSGYLEWLEEKEVSEESNAGGDDIDWIADMFIADCHERFRLEKVESDRRFQEMLARSV